jgi:hypothetical protein
MQYITLKAGFFYPYDRNGIVISASGIEAGSSRQHGEMASEGPSGEEPDARS